MKQQFDIQQLAAEIVNRAKRKEDYVADSRDLELVPHPETDEDGSRLQQPGIRVGDTGEFALSDLAHSQIADHTGIPKKYYDVMRTQQPELLASNVNTWFNAKPSRRMVRTLDGRGRAFLSDRYQRMDDDAFAEIVLPVVYETKGAEIVSTGMDDERTHIKFVSSRLEREVKVGDPVQFGIAFSNSEVGRGRLQGSLLVYRLVCSNGMISGEDAFGANHVGARHGKRDLGEIFKLDTVAADGKATLLKLRDFATEILSERRIDEVVERMRSLTAIEIKRPAEAVEKLAKAQGLSEGEQESVLAHLIRGGDLSMWGLLNAVTASAQDEGLSYGRATDLEGIGGRVLALGKADYRELAAAA